MPIYEYECRACGHQFEEWQGINDKPVRKCPECSARKVQRLLSATSFQLKGGGWYSDGYSSVKPGGKTTATASNGNGSSGKSSDKSPKTKDTKATSSKKTNASAAA